MNKKLMLCLLVWLCVIPGVALGGSQLYTGHVVCQTGDYPTMVKTGDLNNDGVPDIVTLNADDDNFSVILTYPNGTFMPQTAYSEDSEESMAVGLADIDGDNYTDILFAYDDYGDEYMQIWMNQGDGTFEFDTEHEVWNDLSDIIGADVDNDGDEDVLVISTYDLGVFLNNGDGTLAACVQYPFGNSWCYSLVAEYLNGDAYIDVAVTNYNADSLWVLENDGSGGFTTKTGYPCGDNPYNVCSADFDHDGHMDLAVSCRLTQDIRIFLNDGSGAFTMDAAYDIGYNLFDIATADFDGDTWADLVSTSWYEPYGVEVLMNDGDGTFGSPTFMGPEYSQGVATADFDSDSYPDIVAVSNDNWVKVMFNDGAGGFPGADTYSGMGKVTGTYCGDINGDDLADVVMACYELDSLVVAINNGDSTFAFSQLAAGNGPYDLVIADLDGVNDLDIAVINRDADSLAIFLSGGGGDFSGGAVLYPLADVPETIEAARLNGDSYDDLVIACDNGQEVYVYLNNGDGSFGTAATFATTDEIVAARIGDLDGDLDLDIIVADPAWENNYEMTALMNDGTGAFTQAVETIPIHDYVYNLYAGDFNADGRCDLAMTGVNSDIWMVMNYGDGNFSDTVPYPTMGSRNGFFGGDFDNDGDLDLAASEESYPAVHVFLNNSSGVFWHQMSFDVGDYCRSIHGADLDDDGDIDLVGCQSNSGHDNLMVVFWNRIDLIPLGNDDDPAQPLVPAVYSLSQNYPNPFNPSTTIRYNLPKQQHVSLTVYNVLGQQVRKLVDGVRPAGDNFVLWSGANDAGQTVSTGVYFYQLVTEDRVESKKMIMLK